MVSGYAEKRNLEQSWVSVVSLESTFGSSRLPSPGLARSAVGGAGRDDVFHRACVTVGTAQRPVVMSLSLAPEQGFPVYKRFKIKS